MIQTMTGDVSRIVKFMRAHGCHLPLSTDQKAIGLERDYELVAGVVYEGYNGHNVWMHVAAIPGARWLCRNYLRYCFAYPFAELGCSRVSGYVEASNHRSRRFTEHLGFTVETTLSGAASDGGDVLVYVMRRKDCKYVKLDV